MDAQKAKRIRNVLIIVVLVGVVVGYVVWYNLYREVTTHYASVLELFKYGSMGSEKYSGIPYWIWQALPEVFPEKLPGGGGGYASLGFTYEGDKDVPWGITKKTIGFERVGTNCAFCHVSSYRETLEDEPTYIFAGVKHTFDAQRYFRFLFECVKDPKYTADNMMNAINEMTDLPFIQSLLYRYVLIPRTKEEMLKMEERLSWWYDIPDCGPGRWIAFNDLKFHFAKQPQDGSIGNPDIPTLWNLRPRQEAKSFHWDGLSDDLSKIMQNACVGAGATEETIPRKDLKRLEEWYLDLPPPKYPFELDSDRVAQGEAIFKAQCADCHEIGNPTAGRNIPIDEIGTDRHRFDLITEALPDAYNQFCKEEYGWPQEWQIRKTEGYNAVFLDGIWLRGPYLHNGSVPTLADLLKPPDERPKVFFRGSDIYDKGNVGFVSQGAEAEKHGFRYDTALPGNGNGGHLYGTTLSDEEKQNLIEYLKTL